MWRPTEKTRIVGKDGGRVRQRHEILRKAKTQTKARRLERDDGKTRKVRRTKRVATFQHRPTQRSRKQQPFFPLSTTWPRPRHPNLGRRWAGRVAREAQLAGRGGSARPETEVYYLASLASLNREREPRNIAGRNKVELQKAQVRNIHLAPPHPGCRVSVASPALRSSPSIQPAARR